MNLVTVKYLQGNILVAVVRFSCLMNDQSYRCFCVVFRKTCNIFVFLLMDLLIISPVCVLEEKKHRTEQKMGKISLHFHSLPFLNRSIFSLAPPNGEEKTLSERFTGLKNHVSVSIATTHWQVRFSLVKRLEEE